MYAVTTTEQSNEGIGRSGPILTAGVNVAQRFEVTTVQGQTIMSEVSSLAVEQGNNCLLTRCITKRIFPFQKFILLDSELDLGGRLQKRVCHKLNVRHDIQGYWESNRELVRVKLTKKRNNVTESIRRKMECK
jgi:hypothetical protein